MVYLCIQYSDSFCAIYMYKKISNFCYFFSIYLNIIEFCYLYSIYIHRVKIKIVQNCIQDPI